MVNSNEKCKSTNLWLNLVYRYVAGRRGWMNLGENKTTQKKKKNKRKEKEKEKCGIGNLSLVYISMVSTFSFSFECLRIITKHSLI